MKKIHYQVYWEKDKSLFNKKIYSRKPTNTVNSAERAYGKGCVYVKEVEIRDKEVANVDVSPIKLIQELYGQLDKHGDYIKGDNEVKTKVVKYLENVS